MRPAKTIPPEQRNAVSSDLLSKKSNYFKRSFLNSGGNHPVLRREMLLTFLPVNFRVVALANLNYFLPELPGPGGAFVRPDVEHRLNGTAANRAVDAMFYLGRLVRKTLFLRHLILLQPYLSLPIKG